VYAFLGFLALIEPQVAASVIDTLVPSGDYHIVLTTRSRGSIPSALWNCSYIIFLADRAGHAAERAPALRKLSRPR